MLPVPRWIPLAELSAQWVSVEEALSRLVGPDWYDPEPLTRWLTGNAERGATYVAESD